MITVPNIEHKYASIIHNEIIKILSKPHHLKGYLNIEVIDITIIANTYNKEVVSLSVKFTRNTKVKESIQSNISGQCGIQVYIPRKIIKHRDSLINQIFK